jgi:hypothetical protein
MAVPVIPGGPSYSGGAGGAAGPSLSDSQSGFDSSGWVVNFGSGSIDGGVNKYVLWGGLAVGGLLLWRMLRSKR